MTTFLIDDNNWCAITSLLMPPRRQDLLETEKSKKQRIEVIEALGRKNKTYTLNLNITGSMYLLAIMSHK